MTILKSNAFWREKLNFKKINQSRMYLCFGIIIGLSDILFKIAKLSLVMFIMKISQKKNKLKQRIKKLSIYKKLIHSRVSKSTIIFKP